MINSLNVSLQPKFLTVLPLGKLAPPPLPNLEIIMQIPISYPPGV
jgi:hypothetical protein